LEGRDRIRILTTSGEVVALDHGLDLLRAFSHPTSVASALESLRSQGIRDWIEASSTLLAWVEQGILVEPGHKAASSSRTGYEAAPVHAAMLNDRARTAAFIHAIEARVHPGDTVVDIGTGTGILAMAAARAGAGHVFAVEASSMAECASQVFAANGLAGRITLIRGRSTEVSLPRKADVVVTEMIGHHPLGEGLLEIVGDALSRLAKPGARVIPHGLTLLGIPVEVPEADLAAHSACRASLASWKEWYGFDLTPFGLRAPNSCFFTRSDRAAKWRPLSDAVSLVRFDLRIPPRVLPIDATADAEAKQSGELNAVILAMDIDLGDSTLTTRPDLASASNHWLTPVWLPTTPARVTPGDSLRLRFCYGSGLHGRQGFVDATATAENGLE